MTESIPDVCRIAITGGPCGAKTTIKSYLEQQLPEHTVHVNSVPEAARIILGGNVTPPLVGSAAFQEAIMDMQMQHEDLFSALHARLFNPPERTVFLYDRGVMDSRAYVDEDVFNDILERRGWTIPQLRDARYDAVIHLVTAANGAEQFYVQDTERFESIEQARILDLRTQQAWTGHQHLKVIGNEGDLEDKKQRTLHHVLHLLGLPIPLEIERKYLVDRTCLNSLPRDAIRVLIEQVYLSAPNAFVEERVRRRREGASSVCYRTLKEHVSVGVRRERERQIPLEGYRRLTTHVRPGTLIKKYRWCFLYEGQYFELDDFSPMGNDLCMLEIELTNEADQVSLPPWITGAVDVTENPAYTNREIALNAA